MNLDANYTRCQYGLYTAIAGNNWTTGKVDYGSEDARSRHTIHDEIGKYDPRTLNSTDPLGNPVAGGLLEVPPGEDWSVRLGNWQDGNVNTSRIGEAERITYDFDVTAAAPYLLLKYAVIWESPNHQDKTPRFIVEILEENNTPASVSCGQIDIEVAQSGYMNYCTWTAYNSVWNDHHTCVRYNAWTGACVQWQGGYENVGTDHNVYWQDWRTVGINLSDYIGRRVRIRITSSDCGYTIHFGYSYFNLKCVPASVFDPKCGDSNSANTFTAPDGFEYRWYKLNPDSSRIGGYFSTNRQVEVQSNNQLYECVLRTPGNSSCDISIYAQAEPRLPKADFTLDIHKDCVDTVFLQNTSYVSPDKVVPYVPHRDVDSVFWDLGDGRFTKNDASISGQPIVYAQDGTYTIRQIAKLANGDCEDIMEKTVTVRGSETRHVGEVYDTICGGSKYTWNGSDYTATGVYSYVMPNAAANGYCDSIVRLHLKVWDSYYIPEVQDVLEGKNVPYHWHRNGNPRDLYENGVYWDSCKSVHGCDSVYKLELRVHPKYLVEQYDTICSGTNYTYGGKIYNFKDAKDTICYDSLTTKTWGNDSVCRLHLHVKQAHHIYETKHFCKRTIFSYHGQNFEEPGDYLVSFKTKESCDSVYHLTLIEDESPIVDTVAVITDKDKPYIWHGINCSGSGTYSDTLTAANGCDSIVRLRLTIYPTSFHDDGVIKLCKDSSMTWHTRTLTGTTPGTFVVWDSLKNVYGYDSVYKATLKVLPSYRISYSVTQAIGTHYYGFFGQDISVGGEYTYRGTTEEGCDSIVKLTITFKPTYLIKDTAYICEGTSHKYHKNHAVVYYTEEGVYWDSLKTEAGYDSIYRLQLYVNKVYTTPISATICDGATYDFFGTPLTTANTYTKTLKSHGLGGCACDSTVVLTLNVNPSYDIRIDSTICEGESVLFSGTSRTEGGVYTQSHKTKNGCNCDSIETLNLTVNPKLRIYHTVPLCEGESWYWKRKNEYISTNRDVSDTTTSKVTKCDSIDIWKIYVHPVVRDTVRAAICLGKTYPFRDHTYTGTTVGNDTITLGGTSIHGCDSLHTLILTVNPTYYEQRIDTSLCLGDYITIHNKTYSRGGTYYDTLKTEGCHCDSAFIINVEEHPRFFSSIPISLCKDSTMMWHGKEIKGPGTYYDSLKSTLSHGVCDSIYELIVIQQLPKEETIEVTILSTGSYSFNGESLKESGTYRDTLHATTGGCDSIVTLILTVKPVYKKDTTITICRGGTYTFNGKQLENGGLYTEKFISKYGTDSVVNLTLVVLEPIINQEPVHITDRQTYTWHRESNNTDSILTVGGIYDDTISSKITGCDSINRLVLVRHQTYEANDSAEICKGRKYNWHNQTCDTTGDYYDTLKNAMRPWLDSIYYHLHLTVNPVYKHDTTVYICSDGTYNFNGRIITEGGTYYDTIKTPCCGCDSTFILHVEKRQTVTYPMSDIICPKDTPYVWHPHPEINRKFTVSGNYKDTIRTADGLCDSAYYTLALTVKPSFKTNLPEATICANQWYNFCGRLVNQPRDYDTTLTAMSNGCDSVVHVHLNVNPTYEKDTTFILCSGSTLTFNNHVYTHGGDYRDTLRTKNDCNCDSIYNITISEIHPFSHTEEVYLCKDSTMEWHNMTITGPGTYHDNHTSVQSKNLCDSSYTLIVHEQKPSYARIYKTIWSSNPYWFNDTLRTATGVYYDTVPSPGNKCDSITELHLTVLPVYDITYSDTICRGATYDFNGTLLEESGFYTKTLVSSHGTDSVVNLNLIVWEPRIKSSIVHIIDKALPYTWTLHDGSTTRDLTHAGTYDDSLKSVVTDCDSINRLELVVHPTTLVEKDTAICQGKAYYWHNQSCSATNHYYDTLKNAKYPLLDSIYYHLDLRVNPIYKHDTTAYLCSDGQYNFNGKIIKNAGTYYDTLKTHCCGCDSTFILRVEIRQTETKPLAVSICPSDTPYVWDPHPDIYREYSVSGNYKDTIRAKDGLCDSIYYTLALTVKPSFKTNLPEAMICANQWYNFCGRLVNQPGDYDTTLTAMSNGCDSVVHVHLNVNPTHHRDTVLQLCSGGSVEFNGRSYSHGGNYRDTLWTKNGCNCDSVYDIFVNEVAPFYQIETKYLCKDSTIDDWHGQAISNTKDSIYYDKRKSVRSGYKCDSIYELHVIIRNPEYTVLPKTILSTSYYYFNGKLLNEEGIYYDTVPAVNNTCDSIIELRLTVLPVYTTSATHTMCRGESYLFKDTTIETSGLYTRTFRSVVYGTDSVVTLQVTVYEPAVKPTVVHINDKQTYTWHRVSNNTDSVVSVTGMYDDTIKSKVTGCDSINRIQLFVHKTYLFNELGETCEGKPFRWRGNDYPATVSGVFEYYDSLTTKDARSWIHDSVYHLTLTVNPIYRHDTTVSLCEGNYYDLNGTHLYAGGIYYDTIKTVNRCDSAFRVQVNIRTTRSSYETKYICPGENCEWRGKQYTIGDEYADTLRTEDGKCDSIYYNLTLRIKTRYEKDIVDEICSKELPYDFHGRLLYEEGDYDTTFTSITTKCDSIIHLHLKVNKSYDFDRYDTICRGQSVLFDNVARTESGIYVYDGTTKAGCDSVVKLHLTVIEKQNAYIEQHICEGDYFELNGVKITESGTYTETATSQYGCDSTTTWRISVHKPKRDTVYRSICAGKECNFNDVIYRKEGIYIQENKSRYNCDSTYVLVLSVNPVYSRDTSLVLCEKDYFAYNGNIYRDGGHYQDTARTKNGCNCDSILNITITKYPVVNVDTTAYICRGEYLTWHGRTYSRGGYYYDTLKMNSGLCDSIVYGLHLVVSSDFYEEQAVSICDDNYLSFRGHTYNKSGIYYDSLTTALTGCDSVYCVRLTVNPTYRNVTTENRCDIDPYWYNGRWLSETGDYVQSMKTNCGCDSVNVLQLIVSSTKRDTVRMNICDGNAITYMGRTITQTGTYRDTVNQPEKNQCIINVLEASFYAPTIISNVIVDNICADDAQFRMRAYYSGNRPTTYSLEFDDHARAEGFKNILDAPFEDIIVGPIPQFDGSDYVRPDYYKALLTVDNTLCAKTESAQYEVQLLVRYPSWIIEQNWNDVVALLNENYNGGYRFSKYEWIVNNNMTGNYLSYLYLPKTLGSGDEVAISLTREGENYAVPSCPIVIYDKTSELVSEYPVLAHPTEVRGQIRIVAQTDGEYALYTTTGKLIISGKYRDGEQQLIQTQVAEGCYLLRLSTQTHGVQTKKIILR